MTAVSDDIEDAWDSIREPGVPRLVEDKLSQGYYIGSKRLLITLRDETPRPTAWDAGILDELKRLLITLRDETRRTT